MWLKRTGLFLLAGVWLPGGCAGTSAPALEPVWTEIVTPLGSGFGVHGADGAASVDLPNRRTLWLLADSWVGTVRGGRYAPGSMIVNNAIVWHPTPVAGEKPEEAEVEGLCGPPLRPGQRSAWLMPGDGPNPLRAEWCWPTGGAAVVEVDRHQRLVIFFNDMAQRDPNAALDVWNFRSVGNRAAVIDNPGDDPAVWRVRQFVLGPRRAGERQISWGVAVVPDPTDVAGPSSRPRALLVFGVDTTDGANKKAVLARVWADDLHRFENWRFWDGSGWTLSESEVGAVVEDVVDEFSVHWQAGAGGRPGGFVMVHGEPMLGTGVFVRSADAAQGPWSEAVEVYRAPEPESDERLIVYGAKGHSELSGAGELLISYCVNTQDFKQMVEDVTIYRPRFIRVTMPVWGGK